MALVATHRQIVYRLPPQRRSTWRLLERTLEDQRQLWNAALEERIVCSRKTGRSLTFFDQCKSLTQCRRDDPEVAACPVAIQRGTLRRLDEAYKHFFRRVRDGQTPGFPRFKGRSRFDSISVVSGVKARDGRLHVPGFGPLAIRRKGGNPCPGGKPVSAVLKRVGGRWHAIVCLSVEVEEPADNGRAVDLDRNGGQVADSDGGIFQMPDMARLEARSRRLQRKLSRQRKASRRRERTKRHLARVRRRTANRRKNWHHHVSRRLAAKAGTVAVEGLNVKAMTRSAKGTADVPGTRVAQKSGMNRAVRDTGWTALKRMLDCKAANLILVPAKDTSQTCHECGAKDERSRDRRTRAKFRCVACGHRAHADINAAKNILAPALGGRAGRDEASGIGAPARREAIALATSTDP